MLKLRSLLAVMIVAAPTLLWPTALHAEPASPGDTECLYPSPTDRFGLTVYTDTPIDLFDVSPLSAGRYLDWQAFETPSQPNGLHYYQMIRVWENGYRPNGQTLQRIVVANPGALWIIGNEADVIWQDNTTPEAYARHFHDVYTTIKAIDPTAKFVSNGLVQISPLRLAWLNRVWDTYRSLYGTDMPVDIWNTHTYIAHEMHVQAGFEIPPGIPNAVGFSDYFNPQWTLANDAGASGGTVHQSRTANAKAWFGFRGSEVTIYFRTGPDAGIALIDMDHNTRLGEVDLYAPTRGTISRTFTNLPLDPNTYGDRHNIRAQVTGRKNPASSDTWIRVDAIRAPSTTNLPGGVFEDDDPLQARITDNWNNQDNLDVIVQQIRDFRQWLADHGQRDKPLIDTEFGILLPEDLGYTYPRVRTFMLASFDRFLNDLVDPTLGYPADGNRLLQEWFWFALSVEQFEGYVNHSGLYDGVTYAIKPLGVDFANFVAPLRQDYRDPEAVSLTLTPTWALFAGDPSRIEVEGVVRNMGNTATGPFQVTARLGNGDLITTWNVATLAQRFEPGHVMTLNHDWRPVFTRTRTIWLIVDEADQIVEPCGNSNNTRSFQLVAPASTDLALSNLTTVPALLPPIPPGTTTSVTLKVDLANLGSVGTAAQTIAVNFWHGDPAAGGTLIGNQVFTPGNVSLPGTASVTWPNRAPGTYDVFVTVDQVPEETNLQNNRLNLRIIVPASVTYVPLSLHRSGRSVEEVPGAPLESSKATKLGWLP